MTIRSMPMDASTIDQDTLPKLDDLGRDLLLSSSAQRVLAIVRPLLCVGAYFGFAFLGWWIAAIAAVAGLMFITYASVSHDLLHRTPGFSRRVNDFWLAIIEALVLRSGHAFRVTHLQHHRRFPADDDIEGAVADKPWWTLAISGLTGFASFLLYLEYGYLDTWHGMAALLLIPLFGVGLARARVHLRFVPRVVHTARVWRQQLSPPMARAGWWLLCAYGLGLVAAGLTISILGATRVFVATDLAYIGLTIPEICGISDRLVSVIAHDRAGFGGGLFSTGVVVLGTLWNASLTKSLVQILALSGARRVRRGSWHPLHRRLYR
ncbi:MAG: fatty acid desaturase [Opitutaceae bacterium]